MDNLNKHLLLFFAVLFMLIFVPTAFASDIDDADAFGVENQLAADDVSIPSTDDVGIETVSAGDKESASDESDVIAAGNDAIYVDGFDGSGGSGTSNNPYHSLKNVLNSSTDLGNEINLLPGTYDFGGTVADLYDRDYTLNAMGDVVFTSSDTLFHKYGNETFTLNGIKFKDITSSSSAILYTGSSVVGTLNFNDCTFINNKGANLISTSYNINVDGCTFIDNEATGTVPADGGLIENFIGSPTINIRYSIFIGNIIHYSNNGFSPIIVNSIGDGPNVSFDYNFVNDNAPLSQDEIMSKGTLNRYSNVNIVATAPDDVPAGDTVDLAVNFTKADGSALNEYMPSLTVSLVPNVNVASIPVTITNNGGKGQYTAKNGVSYTENVDVKYDEYVLDTFEFYVADGNLLNPELTVTELMVVDMGSGEPIGVTHLGDGAVSYVSADEAVATVDANGVVTGVGEGITTVTVNIAPTDTYGGDSKQVTVMVKDPADAGVIYVDGFDGPAGGSGIKVDPYHSLIDVLVDVNSGKEIRLLPNTYDFTNIIDLKDNAFVITAYGDDVIFTTSNSYMFKVDACDVTFNGIKFKDSNVDNSVVTRTFSSNIGTLNFNNCDFINNTGDSLIKSSCNVNIKGCKFIDNKAKGTYISNCGLIHNHYASTNTISITYSIFINNEISYSNNGYNPMIVDWNNGNGPRVIFNYNFVNNNNQINNNAIAYHASSITKAGYTVITPIAPNSAYTAHPVDLVVKFTKNGGSDLDDIMPDLDIELAPTVKTGSIPVTITDNVGTGEYIAKRGNTYTETVAVKVNGNTVTTFQFNVIKSNYYYTKIVADDLVMSYKDGSAWTVTLIDDFGDSVSGATVKIGINIKGVNKIYSFVTDENGAASLAIGLTSGTYAVNATFEGSNIYESSFANATVTVNKAAATLSGADLEMSYKDGSSWAVTLTDPNGNPITGVKVAFGIVGKTYYIDTDASGVAELAINLASGTYTINASFSNSKYAAELITATITVNKAVPVLSAEDLVMNYKDGSAWNVTLKDANGNAMVNTYLKVNILGKTYNLKTNDDGVASLPIGLAVRNYTISARYEGNKNFNAVEINKTIVVNPPEYNLVAEDVNMTYQDGTSYNVQLTYGNGSPVAKAGVVIKMTINNHSYNRKTNAEGIASLPIGLISGTYTITAEYNGKQITNTIVVNKA